MKLYLWKCPQNINKSQLTFILEFTDLWGKSKLQNALWTLPYCFCHVCASPVSNSWKSVQQFRISSLTVVVEKTGKTDLGVWQEKCCLYSEQRPKHSSFQSQHNPSSPGFVSHNPLQDIHYKLHPFPIKTLPHPLTRFETVLHVQVFFLKKKLKYIIFFLSLLEKPKHELNKHIVHLDQRTSSWDTFCL